MVVQHRPGPRRASNPDNYKTGGAFNGQENADECSWIAPGSAGGAGNVVMGNGSFTGVEDASLQTSFVLDDTAVTVS
jgi:hypothetical protein